MSEEDKGGTSEPAKSLNPDLGYQLLRLARKFPQQLVRQIKKGTHTEDYINHAVIAQRILQVCGPYSWDWDVVTEDGKVVAVHGKLTVELDGKTVTVSGAGTETYSKDSTGEKIKKMESDAFKRAASRLGCGLHLWAQDQYFLDIQLAKDLNLDLKEVS
jgi:hypothetical protein|tara:strand:+ start:1525 stop:2001 length:477 start_codon:yes stop_codon:yes gene_type:complete